MQMYLCDIFGRLILATKTKITKIYTRILINLRKIKIGTYLKKFSFKKLKKNLISKISKKLFIVIYNLAYLLNYKQ